jgi:hypothetical protein
MRVQEMSEDKYWTAKEWAMRTRIPYRSILAAAARGDLPAVRPSGTRRGAILISEESWSAWIERSRLPARASSRLEPPPTRAQAGSLRDLALR